MFEQVDTLPGAQAELHYRLDAQAGVGQHGAHVGGRVIGSLQGVAMPALVLWDEPIQESLQILLAVGS